MYERGIWIRAKDFGRPLSRTIVHKDKYLLRLLEYVTLSKGVSVGVIIPEIDI